jgi:uracil phosphoribosyltransferase
VPPRRLCHTTGLQTLVADHPLVAHKLTVLRDQGTDTPTFRGLTDELVTLLAYEATRYMRTEPVSVTTPVAPTTGVKLASPNPLVVPVLRAGIGMLDGMTRLLPSADVGFVGLARDEETLVASTYAARLPEDLTGRDAFVLDPMLATGGTLETVVGMLVSRGDLPALRARGRGQAGACVPERRAGPGPRRDRGDGRAAQRPRLHRPRPRRRRRPLVR